MAPHRRFVVTLLVVLAGCGAPLGAGSSEPPTETLTPVPVDTPNETRTQAVIQSTPPPGVSDDGSVAVNKLLRTHNVALDGHSYTWTLTYDVNNSAVTELDREFTRQVRVEGDRFLVKRWLPRRAMVQTLYVEDSSGYVRIDTVNGAGFYSLADPGDDEAYAIGKKLVWRYLRGLNLTVDVVTHGGQTYYRLSAVDDIPTPLVLRGGLDSGIDEYRVTAYVTPAGLVKTLIVDYVRLDDGNHHQVSVRFDYEALNQTSVTRPDWVDQVTPGPNQTSTSRWTPP